MTKERKLAIQMWQKIKDKITDNSNFTIIDICIYKEVFCRKHNLFWKCNCWFCEYMPTCEQCPLRDCTVSSSAVYEVACDTLADKEKRLDACDKIIAALKGEYKYERNMKVGELKRMLEPFSDDKEVVFKRVTVDVNDEEFEDTTWESDMQVHNMYGKSECIIELEDI